MEITLYGKSLRKVLSQLHWKNESTTGHTELYLLEFLISRCHPEREGTLSDTKTPSKNGQHTDVHKQCYTAIEDTVCDGFNVSQQTPDSDCNVLHHLHFANGVWAKDDASYQKINGCMGTNYKKGVQSNTNLMGNEVLKENSSVASNYFHQVSLELPGNCGCCEKGTNHSTNCDKCFDWRGTHTDSTPVCGQEEDLANLFCNAESLGDLIQYMFTRRYGLADERFQTLDAPAHPTYASPSSKTEAETDIHRKLDILIQKVTNYPVCDNMVLAYADLLSNASHLPIVRSKTVEHVMTWLASNSDELNDEVFQKVQSLILAGATDVWSAVRKTCSSGLPKVFLHWTQNQQKYFFTTLLEICINCEMPWQSKDGAALCLSSVIHNCYPLKTNRERLPGYVSECIPLIIYSLISHPQLCIRETVAHTMSAYVKHVDTEDRQALLNHTLLLMAPSSQEWDSKGLQLVEAYAAEGLLSLCISLFKVLSVNQILVFWPKCCNTFLAYLAHDASSVRQTASMLFAHIATRTDSTVVMLMVVLHHLSSFWNVEVNSLANCLDFFQDPADSTGKWEAKEGRMFVYELICQQLGAQHSSFLGLETHQQPVTADAECTEGSSCKLPDRYHSSENKYAAVKQYLCSMPWLTQLYLLDNRHILTEMLHIEKISQKEHHSIQWWLLTHQIEKTEISDCCEDWFKSDSLPPCRELFLTLLHQTAACLANTQWELHRIAQQILPHLCEVIWLYSTDLMQLVWRYTTDETSLKSFLGLSMMRQSLSHCAHILNTANLTGRGSTLASSFHADLVDSVRKNITDYLPFIACFLKRPVFDKISVIAAEITLLAVNIFDLDESVVELSEAVLYMWKSLFAFAHPRTMVASLLPKLDTDFSLPTEGFLSCCLVRPENKVQCAKQVETTLVSTIHRLLPKLFPLVESQTRAWYLPVLGHYIRLFSEDTDMCKSLLTSLCIVSCCSERDFEKAASEETPERKNVTILRCILCTLRELASVICIKNLDLLLVEKVLECYLRVCGSIGPAYHVPLLLKNICRHLNGVQSLPDDLTDENIDLNEDLQWYHPTEISFVGEHSSISENYGPSSPRRKDGSGDSLNTSGRTLGSWSRLCAQRRRTFSTTSSTIEIHEEAAGDEARDKAESSDSDSSSDWDSWSEEEADCRGRAGVKTVFQDFLLQLKTIYGADLEKILEEEREKMTEKDRNLMDSLATPQTNTT